MWSVAASSLAWTASTNYPSQTPRCCFLRCETDAELLARASAAVAGGYPIAPRPGESVDDRADRCGVRRRIVEDVA